MKAAFHITEHPSGGAQLTVKGDLTVAHAQAFKKSLLELLSAPQTTVTISLQEVTAMDVSAIQGIYAFCESLRKTGKSISLVWPEQEAVDELMTKSGFKQALMNISR